MKNQAKSLNPLPAPEILASSGRDELNIAEFPIALLTDRPPEGLTSISFSDKMVDRGETITRTVTVEGTASYGLPMPFDMDILLCLMQLTKAANNFTDPQVFFSRGDILKLMRLADSGPNYTRLDDSMRRWHGVSLFYDQSWWDREENCWTTQEGIHIFEHLHLMTRKSPRRRKPQGQLDLFRCSFTWNSIFFKSCQAKNIKFLDMDKYFGLERAISRQMYRFLDKRFYRGPAWSFDLREFAFEHIGISRNYDIGQIKSKLRPAIEELEAIGFLEPLGQDERYEKNGKEWKIHLLQKFPAPSALSVTPPATAPEPLPVVAELIKRGVTEKTAAELVAKHPAETIQLKLEVFDWMDERKDKRIAKSPAGYLVKSINDGYATPEGFTPRAERERKAEAIRQQEQAKTEASRRKQQEAVAERAEQAAITVYRKTLTPEQLAEHEAAALAQADDESRRAYDDPVLAQFRKTLLHKMTNRYIRTLLQAEGKLPAANP